MMDGRVKTLHPHVHGGLLALRDEPGARQGDEGARHRRHRPPRRAISTRSKRPSRARPRFDETHREHRHRRPRHDPRRGQEPRLRRRRRRRRRLRAGPRRTRSEQTARSRSPRARRSPPRPTPAPPPTTPRSRPGSTANSRTAKRPEEREPPRRFALGGKLKQSLRYGENPHQIGRVLRHRRTPLRRRHRRRRVGGKELSYNNINDTDAAYEVRRRIRRQAIGRRRHHQARQPLRRRHGRNARRSLRASAALRSGQRLRRHRRLQPQARRRDRRSSSRKFSPKSSSRPTPTTTRRRILSAKKNLRLLLAGGLPDPATAGHTLRTVAGGFLLQIARQRPHRRRGPARSSPSASRPTHEITDLIFAFRVAKHVKSNTIVYAKDGATAGIGAGQMSRIDSARIAAWKAQEAAKAAGLSGVAGQRLGGRLRRLLPLRRRPHRRRRSRRHRGHPARRLDPRRRSHRRRRRARPRDGLHRHAPLPALTRSSSSWPGLTRPPSARTSVRAGNALKIGSVHD